MSFIIVADLPDPNDKEGRTYREVNMAKVHNIPIGALVGTPRGTRLFVVMHGRDCDGTPLYGLGEKPGGEPVSHGWGEESLFKVERIFNK